jgi:hypothetical protein
MDEPIKGYGAIGLILTSPFIFGAALLVKPLAAQCLLAVFGLGVLTLGFRVYRRSYHQQTAR